MARGCHTGQHRYRTLPSLQKVLSGSATQGLRYLRVLLLSLNVFTILPSSSLTAASFMIAGEQEDHLCVNLIDEFKSDSSLGAE